MRDSRARSNEARQQHDRRGLLAAAVMGLAALATGCSGTEETFSDTATSSRPTTTVAGASSTAPAGADDQSRPSETTGTDLSPSSVPSAGPTEQDVIRAYVAFWDARFEANEGTPDPDAPALRATATGEQLLAVVGETQANLDGGLAFKARPNPANFRTVAVIAVNGDAATVQECVVDDGLVVRRDNGAVVNDTVETHNARGELVREQGTWRVARVELVQRWNGIDGCAADS